MSQAEFSAAAERNKLPILEVLCQVLPDRGKALEIASGTGQHVAWFAAALPGWTWQPTDYEASALPGIAARIAEAGVSAIRAPLRLDVMAAQWPSEDPAFTEPFDAIFCANMLHIAPWAACAALMRGSARLLVQRGVLLLYGPYLEDGVPPAQSNLDFDESLRARNAAWGMRRLEDVVNEAKLAGLALLARHAMPANNLLLVFGGASSHILSAPAQE